MKQILVLLGILLIGSTISAQRLERSGKHSNLEKMKSELNLSEVQVKEMEERKAQYQAVLKNEALSKEEKKTKIIEMQKAEKDILTAEQRALLKNRRYEQKAERMLNRHDRGSSREQMKIYRAEFNDQITKEDQAMIQKIKVQRKAAKVQEEGKKSIDQNVDLKMLKSLSLKYEDKVTAFLQEKGMKDVQKKRSVGKVKRSESNIKRKEGKHGKGRKDRKGSKVTRFLLMDF